MLPSRKELLIFGVFVLAFPSFGQDTLKLSVSEAQAFALEYNRSVQASKIDVEVAKRKVQETLDAYKRGLL